VVVDKRIARVVRYASFLIPGIIFVYGVLVQFLHFDKFTYPVNNLTYLAITAPWVAIGLAQLILPIQRKIVGWAFLFLVHLFAGLVLVFITSFSTPLTPGWTMLFLASYAYFKKEGLYFSVVMLILAAIADSILHFNLTLLSVNTITAIGVLLLGMTAIALGRIQESETSRSRAQEILQRDRILTLVNNLADAVLSTDEKGVVRIYNAACLSLLDTNTSLNGQSIGEILKLRDKDDNPINLIDELHQAHAVISRDDLVMKLEDEVIRLEITYSPIRNTYTKSKRSDAGNGYVLILRDITKAKSLEEERDEFISVVSHELRTPITIAEGTLSNIQVMMDRQNIAKNILKDGLKSAHDQVIFLARMVNDLSTLSRAERGTADTAETIKVRDLVDEFYAEYAPQAAAKKLHFNLDVGAHLGYIHVSKLYLQEMLQNLITNAIKYTKEGSVTLSAHRSDDILSITVKDTGIGISKSDQAKIFHKFYRSEDYRTRETGGTGLGLYVAAKLADKLDTKIELVSRLNHGSSFSFTLPSQDKKNN